MNAERVCDESKQQGGDRQAQERNQIRSTTNRALCTQEQNGKEEEGEKE